MQGVTADSILGELPDERGERQDAEEFLKAILQGGEPVPARDVFKAAKTHGISDRTLKRTKARLGVRSKLEGFGKEQDLLTDLTVLADSARKAEVLTNLQALFDFKAWLHRNFVCDSFTTPDDLGRKIAIALAEQARKAPTGRLLAAPLHGEIRIVQALQPAPHFHGRETLSRELKDRVSDPASPDRVLSLVAAGGTGKTAGTERVVADLEPGEASVLVWSFYERPDADAFLQECNHLFLDEKAGPTGLLHAETCGYRLLRIELLVARARARLIWPDPPLAVRAAREALDLSADPDCGYAWGEADAAQAWGEAYIADCDLELARRAFTRALEVRRRIEHPGIADTERWLARTA